MNAIADALVYATSYINLRDEEDDERLDEDVGALESIAGFLSHASEEEKSALADAATRAHASEKAGAMRESFLADYETWMEDMFGDEWDGNQRVN